MPWGCACCFSPFWQNEDVSLGLNGGRQFYTVIPHQFWTDGKVISEGWMGMEAVDCKTAGQLLGSAISPPTNHYNHGESPHLKACLCTSNLNLPCSAKTSCKSLDGYQHHRHKRHHWHRTTISSALLIHFRTEGVTQSDVIGFSMRPGDSLPSQHQAICARISP